MKTWDPYVETIRLGLVGFLTAILVVLLLNVDQAVECLVVLAEDFDKSGHWEKLWFLFTGLVAFSWMLWYWTRALQHAFLRATPSRLLNRTRCFIPRIVGAVPFIGMFVAFFRAAIASRMRQQSVFGDLCGFAFLSVGLACASLTAWQFWPETFPSSDAAPRGKLSETSGPVLVISALLAFLFGVAVTLDCQVAQRWGAIAIVLSAACVWVVVLQWLVYFGTLKHLPVFWGMILWVAIWSWCDTNDNHQLTHSATTGSPVRAKLENTFDSWLDSRRDSGEYLDRGYPVVLVAAEGGGIYAAYHAALVLADLQDRYPRFAQHVFVVSGVSGGSVGASVFTALAAQNTQTVSTTGNGQMMKAAIRYFYPDFLSPLIGKALYPDTLQQFLFWPVHSADRATALEQSFELAWGTASVSGTSKNPFSDDFDALWPDFVNGAAPALMLNTTEVESGRQVVVSNLGAGKYGPLMFFDIHPSVHLPLSTAATLSARFPVLTPAGLEPLPEGDERRYVDGGYFENSGLSTLSQVIAELLEHGGSKKVAKISLVVIRIGLSSQDENHRISGDDIGSDIEDQKNTTRLLENLVRRSELCSILDPQGKRARYHKFIP